MNDSLNEVLWHDDSQITWLLRSKTKTDKKEGKTIIFMRELDNGLADYDLIISDIMENIRVDYDS